MYIITSNVLGLRNPYDHSNACDRKRAVSLINQGVLNVATTHYDGLTHSRNRPSVIALPSKHQYRVHIYLNIHLGQNYLFYTCALISYYSIIYFSWNILGVCGGKFLHLYNFPFLSAFHKTKLTLNKKFSNLGFPKIETFLKRNIFY
jgi:hypothetical protein